MLIRLLKEDRIDLSLYVNAPTDTSDVGGGLIDGDMEAENLSITTK